MTTEPLPAGVLGTPPEPHRSALVNRERVRGALPPLPAHRTSRAVREGLLALVLIALIDGVWHLEAAAVATLAAAVPGTVWGIAWKSAREHALRVGP